jgi:hypothetical protein
MNGNIKLNIIFASSLIILVVILITKFTKKSFYPTDQSLPITSVAISNKTIDVGRVNIKEEVDIFFILHNTGIQNLYIDRIEVSCHCTSGVVSGKAILPGDSLLIPVKYNKKVSGYFYQDVLVYGNFDTSPEILSFEGYLVEE